MTAMHRLTLVTLLGAVGWSTTAVWICFNVINDQRVALRRGEWKLLARLDGGLLPMQREDSRIARVRCELPRHKAVHGVSRGRAEQAFRQMPSGPGYGIARLTGRSSAGRWLRKCPWPGYT